jgi:uncharacterized membrane protein YqhA
VLKAFMSVEKISDRDMMWLVGIHLTLVVSAVAFSISDWLQSKGKREE